VLKTGKRTLKQLTTVTIFSHHGLIFLVSCFSIIYTKRSSVFLTSSFTIDIYFLDMSYIIKKYNLSVSKSFV